MHDDLIERLHAYLAQREKIRDGGDTVTECNGEPLTMTDLRQAAAEIESLRAEVDRLEAESQSRLEACGDAVSKLCAAQGRAELLEKAARRVTAAFRAHGETTPFTREAERTRHECEDAMLALDAALKQENDDA